MIAVHQLTKRYGRHTAVEDVSFHCEPGTVTGFLGPNGAGKSTTMRMICGLTPPTAGTATVDGRPYRQLPNPGRTVGVLLDASARRAGPTGAWSASCSTGWGWARQRPGGGCGRTRWACVSGSAWRTRCWVTPGC